MAKDDHERGAGTYEFVVRNLNEDELPDVSFELLRTAGQTSCIVRVTIASGIAADPLRVSPDVIARHIGTVHGMRFCPQNGKLLSSGVNGTKLIDVTNNCPDTLIELGGEANTVGMNHSGSTMAWARYGDATICVRCFNSDYDCELPGAYDEDGPCIHALAVDNKGEWLVVGAYDNPPFVFYFQEDEEPLSLDACGGFGQKALMFSPDGKKLAVASGDDVHLFDVGTWDKPENIGGELEEPNDIAWSPDSSKIATGGCDNTQYIRLFDCASREWVHLHEHRHTSKSNEGAYVAFSPDGALLVSAAADDEVLFFDTKTHKQLGGFSMGQDGLTGIAFLDDTHILTAGRDGTILSRSIQSIRNEIS